MFKIIISVSQRPSVALPSLIGIVDLEDYFFVIVIMIYSNRV